MQHRPITGELAADFVGLLAHFWVEGETAKNYVIPILADAEIFFSQSLSEAILSAQLHCKQTAKFKTADHLYEMLQGIKDGCSKPEPKKL
jgi:hypothetical protein